MTYRVEIKKEDGKWTTVFDIEFWLKCDESSGYYSEISVCTCPEGLICLARKTGEKDVSELTEDADGISELRGELYEGGSLVAQNIDFNRPASKDVAYERHFKKLQPAIRERLDAFCDKWGCSLNID